MGTGRLRGWGGGLTEPTTIGVDDSSRGYLPGSIAPGGWQLVIGKANIADAGAHYTADLTFRDAATLMPRARAPFSPTVLRTGAGWYKGDFHVHSRESGDAAATFDEIIALARARHLDFVVLSDHNTVSQHGLIAAVQPSLPDLLLVRGIEVTTYAGHGGALGATAYVDHRIGLDGRTAAQLIRDVNAQGGLFIVNHPALDLGKACIGCAWRHADTPWPEVGAIEIQTGNYKVGITLFTQPSLDLWDAQLDAGARLAAVGGSDDHRAGMDTGGSASEIGSPTTLVWADELSEAAILAGVRAGRTTVALRGPDDPHVELTAIDGDQRLGIGDTATGSSVTVETHVTGGNGQVLFLVEDGVETAQATVDRDDWTRRFEVPVRPSGSRVRAHLTDGVDPIVVTSHVWLAYAAPKSGCEVGREGNFGLIMLAMIAGIALISRLRPQR